VSQNSNAQSSHAHMRCRFLLFILLVQSGPGLLRNNQQERRRCRTQSAIRPPLPPVVPRLRLVGKDLIKRVGLLDEDVAQLIRLMQQHSLQPHQLQHR
jgi:hypothetical protein